MQKILLTIILPMKVSVAQKNLRRAIGFVERVIGKNVSLPILQNIVLKTEGGRLKLLGTNLEIGVTSFLGANIEEFVDAVNQAKAIFEKPTMIIAHTIPGRGVPEIEFDYQWHGKPPKAEEKEDFMAQLRTIGGRIESEHE